MTPSAQSVKTAREVVDKFQLFCMHTDSAIIADDDDVLTEYIAAALDKQIERDAKLSESFDYGPSAAPLDIVELRMRANIAAAIRQQGER